MSRRSKRYEEARQKVPAEKVALAEAVKLLREMPTGKFDSTVELSMHLGIDPKQAEQQMRGSISLPHGVGRTKNVIAFCEGADVEAAKAAGAVEAGTDELVAKIEGGWMDFDVAIAHPSQMKVVSKLGRVLGPSGKMPSPKAGTVTPDVAEAVKEFAAGKVEYRNDDGGNLHVPVGKLSFEQSQLVENLEHFLDFVKKSKPIGIKGIYIRKACISATMTPSIEIEVA